MIGTQLGRWVIDRELGKGAMGSVYFAHAADAPQEVRALKVLAADLLRDPVARQRFQRETDVLCLLDHPNIVRFDGAGTEGETLYYVMEYVNGPDCETRLREKGRWAWSEVLDLSIQVTRGLKFAHDQGIVHRDLKPANILLLRDLNGTKRADDGGDANVDAPPTVTAKIADFGVARVFSQGQLTGSGHFIGTALYMAPEQAAGKPATKRSDFYALGCVMYTLLTGRPPFNGNSIGELVHKHQFAQPERPARLLADLPHDIDATVMQLLSKDPAQRPGDGSVLLKKLESIRGKLDRKHDLTDTAFRSQGPRPMFAAEPGPTKERENSRRGVSVDLPKLLRAALLFAALVLVIGIITWKLTQPRATADELFAKARPLMQSSNSADWDRAWRDYLEPMINQFPDHKYEQQVEEFRQRREDMAALRRLADRNRHGTPRSEAQRFFEQGLARCQSGDVDGGRQIWKLVVDVFGQVESEQIWVRLAQRGLNDVPAAGTSSPEAPEVKGALEQARKLREAGQRDKAEAIWKGLEELYRNQPNGAAVRDLVRAEREKKS